MARINHLFQKHRQDLTNWLFITTIILSLFIYFGQSKTVGDGSEYYAMLISWSENGRPYMTENSWVKYDELSTTGKVEGLHSSSKLKDLFIKLKTKNNQYDFPHFWFYSFLASSIYFILKFLNLSPTIAFLILHFLLSIVACYICWKYYRFKGVICFLILLLCSPILWYINKVHTEYLTFCLSLSGVILFSHQNYLGAMTCFSVLATQNPSFSIIATIMGLFWLKSSPFKHLRLNNILLIILNIILVCLHPIYYIIRHKELTPQLLIGGISFENARLSTLLAPIADLNIGLIPNWPLGTLILVLWLFLGNSNFRSIKKDHILFVILYLVIHLYAQSKTINPNHGAIVHVSRYALWYICLFFPLLITVVNGKTYKRKKNQIVIYSLIVLIGVFTTIRHHPVRKMCQTKPTWLGEIAMRYFPHHYTPHPDIFIKRYCGITDRKKWNRLSFFSIENGRKILINTCKDVNTYNKPEGLIIPIEKKFDWLKFKEKINDYQEIRFSPRFSYYHLTNDQVQELLVPLRISVKEPFLSMFFNTDKVNQYLRDKWHEPGKNGRWSSDKSSIELAFDKAFPLKLFLYAAPVPFQDPHLIITFNGKKLLESNNFSLRIPIILNLTQDKIKKRNTLTFILPNAVRPSESINGSKDDRLLGMFVTKLELWKNLN